MYQANPNAETNRLLEALVKASQTRPDGWLATGVLLVWTMGLLGYQQFLNTTRSVTGDLGSPVAVGDRIMGYVVTSGFGPRSAPATNQGQGSTNHGGVDLATPEGTLVHAPVAGRVECHDDPTGYGTYGVLKATSDPSLEFLAGHLSLCSAGEYPAGRVWGRTGNTGNSSGPHLHWEQREKGRKVHPVTGYLTAAMGGPLVQRVAGRGTLVDFARRVRQQESGGDYSIVNEIGALGAYQFMPDTLAAIAPKAVGRPVTAQEFLGSKAIQDKVALAYWDQVWPTVQKATTDPDTRCRMLAAYHYSGDHRLWDNRSPQGTSVHGGDWPTIAQYTMEVCR